MQILQIISQSARMVQIEHWSIFLDSVVRVEMSVQNTSLLTPLKQFMCKLPVAGCFFDSPPPFFPPRSWADSHWNADLFPTVTIALCPHVNVSVARVTNKTNSHLVTLWIVMEVGEGMMVIWVLDVTQGVRSFARQARKVRDLDISTMLNAHVHQCYFQWRRDFFFWTDLFWRNSLLEVVVG